MVLLQVVHELVVNSKRLDKILATGTWWSHCAESDDYGNQQSLLQINVAIVSTHSDNAQVLEQITLCVKENVSRSM